MRNEVTSQPTSKCLEVTDVRFTAARSEDVDQGLLGWISLVVGGSLKLDGITLRRTLAGQLSLSFPARRDGSGHQHPLIRPLSDHARRVIEAQVFRALGVEEAQG